MKKLLPILLITITTLQVKAQKWELSLQGGSILSHYTGSGATANSMIIESYPGQAGNYTNNPYGKSYAFGYSGGLQLQLVTKANFIMGLGAGYEMINSKVKINEVYPAGYNTVRPFNAPPITGYAADTNYPASGSVNLNRGFICLSPYVGHRFGIKNNSLDILPGADIAIPLSSKDKGSAVAYDIAYTVNNKRQNLTDLRLKLGAAFHIQKLSITGAYAHGVLNYNRKQTGNSNPGAYSDLFQLGLGYWLN